MTRHGWAPWTVLLLTLALASGCQPGSPPAPTAADSAERAPTLAQAASPPLVLHNIARGTREENLLFQHTIIGHYRMP